MPSLVRESLFIGNIGDAFEVLQGNSDTEITHILSVLSSASISFFGEWRSGVEIPTQEIKKVYVGEDFSKDGGSKSALSTGNLLYVLERAGKDLKFVRMAVPLKDMEREDLLDYLDVCLDFVDENRKIGSVLVHCFAGVSRSNCHGLFDENGIPFLRRGTRVLKKSCDTVCPNDGFLEQLKMFEEMGFKVDRDSSIYKRFRLKVLGDSYNRGEIIDSSKFAADPSLPSNTASSATEVELKGVKTSIPAYRCKKCRRVVALQENVVDHVPGEGEASFGWNKRRSGNPYNRSVEAECSSIFVEPLRWMTAVEEGALDGKLSCAHCDARLGHFNWSGIQCSCGSWITPAFQLNKNRVDISTL